MQPGGRQSCSSPLKSKKLAERTSRRRCKTYTIPKASQLFDFEPDNVLIVFQTFLLLLKVLKDFAKFSFKYGMALTRLLRNCQFCTFIGNMVLTDRAFSVIVSKARRISVVDDLNFASSMRRASKPHSICFSWNTAPSPSKSSPSP